MVGFLDLFFDFEALEGFKLMFGGIRFGFVELNAILMDVIFNFLDFFFIVIYLVPGRIERGKVLIIDRINIIPGKYELIAGVKV